MSSTECRIEFGEAEWIASYGFELLPVPAHCARLQLREVQRRWAMWGLHGNTDVEVYEGDFRVLPEVHKRLREADVVVSDNLRTSTLPFFNWTVSSLLKTKR